MAESLSPSQSTQSGTVQPSQPQTSSTLPAASTTIDPNTSTSTVAADDEDLNAADSKKDVSMGGMDGGSANAAGSAAPQGNDAATMAGLNDINPVQAAVPPTKKDTSLREFLGQMDEYAPIIPDAVTAHYLTLAGLPPPGNGPNHTPPHLARLLALATQKFIADIAADAYQFSRIRASNSSAANNPMGTLSAAAGLGTGAAGGQAPGAAGGGSGAGGEAGKGKGPAATGGTLLGVQRPGFGGGGQGGSQGRTVLTMEDLGMAVAEHGVNIKRGEFYR